MPQAELAVLRRVFRYCSGLRERRPSFQRRYFQAALGVGEEDLLYQEVSRRRPGPWGFPASPNVYTCPSLGAEKGHVHWV